MKNKATKEDFESYLEKKFKEKGSITIFKRPIQENPNDTTVEFDRETYDDLDEAKKAIENNTTHELIVM
jgi:hypothetical protein